MKQFKIITIFVALTILLFSCSSEKDKEEVNRIIISTDNTTVSINKKVTFKVVSNLGDNIIEDTKLYVNGAPINGHFFFASQLGKFKIKAIYREIESNEIEISVEDITFYQTFPIIEDYTGTWCGYCPRVTYAIKKLEEKTNKALPITIHASDIMETKHTPVLMNYFNVKSFPSALINREVRWKVPEPNNLRQIINLTKRNALLGIALTSKVEGNKINVIVKVKTSKDFTNTKLVVLLLENGIKQTQENYTNYYDEIPLIDFIHNHVLREAFTDPKGDDIPNNKMTKGNVYTKDLSISIPENVDNIDETDIVAFVVDANKEVLNARKVKTGKNANDFITK